MSARERGIIMTGASIPAILDGRKTMTRRVVQPQPKQGTTVVEWNTVARAFVPWRWFSGGFYAGGHRTGPPIRSPYGAPGDRLWVREAWAAHFMFDDVPPSEMPGDDRHCLWFRASGEHSGSAANGCSAHQRGRWRPSIHMPRWASRILLEVVEVRVERVQEITTEDVWAEGVQVPATEDRRPLMRLSPNAAGKIPASYLPQGRCFPDQPPLTEDEWAMSHFADAWDSLNAKRGHGWEANPWVWVVSFRRIDP